MKIRDVKTNKLYDLGGEFGLLRWGSAGAFHVRSTNDPNVIEVYNPDGGVQDVNEPAHEILPKCPTCGK